MPLSGYFRGHKLQVGWDITSDGGLELGGWQLDDVCIVANPNAICGDGVRTPTEQCDDGAQNADKADVCRTDCHVPVCGDGIVDSREQCDDGEPNDTCSAQCTLIDTGDGGCCSASGGPGSIVASGLVGLLMFRRRRRKK